MSSSALTKINDSEFYMWRTLFAIAHADGVITNEEIRFMVETMEDVPFSEEQKAILNDDIKNGKDIVEMFEKISDAKHQARFFKFAQEMVWADGDFGKAEQDILLKLKTAHVRSTNVDDLIGSVKMDFDDDIARVKGSAGRQKNTREIMFSFREQFFQSRNKKAHS